MTFLHYLQPHTKVLVTPLYTGVGSAKRGYAGDLTPQLFMWGGIDMYIPTVEKYNS